MSTSDAGLVSSLREKFVKSSLDLIVLVLLKNSSQIGAYDLIGLIRDKFTVMVSPGAIYPTLFSLERHGLLETEWRARKKVYQLTEKGSAMIERLTEAYLDKHREMLRVLRLETEIGKR